MSHHHPQLLKENRAKPPGSAGLTKAVEKGKRTAKGAQPCKTWNSHVTNILPQKIFSGTTWIMLSSPYTSFLETDSTIPTHGITAISFVNLHIPSSAGIFSGLSQRKLSYSEDKISFQYKILYYSIHTICKFLLVFCVLGREICLHLIKKKSSYLYDSKRAKPKSSQWS